jgi:hypothetical protein
MIVLNLLLLAQVLEVFLPGGERVSVYRFGSYTWLSLMAGALYSISQTVFGVVAGEVKRKSLVALFLILTAMTILIEMGLAGYRAVQIEGGDPLSPTAADQLLLSKGVVLTMFISFIVPVAHSVLGFVAVPRFLIPTITFVPTALFGLLYWLWSWFCIFFFGFPKVVRVPAAVSNLNNNVAGMLHRIRTLDEEVKGQEKLNHELSQMQKPFADVRKVADEIAGRPGEERDKWSARQRQQAAELRDATDPEQCDEMEREARHNQNGIESRTRALISDAGALDGRLAELPQAAANWAQRYQQLERGLAGLRESLKREQKQHGALQGEFEEQLSILRPGDSPTKRFDDPLKKQLDDIRLAALNAVNPRERTQAMRVYAMCLELLDRLKTNLESARTDMTGLDRRIEKLEQSAAGRQPPPPPPPPEEVTRARTSLHNARREMVRFSGEARASNHRFLMDVVRVRRTVAAGKPAGEANAQKKGPVGRFFAWLGGLFSELIDAVMRANQEPKAKPAEEPAQPAGLPAVQAKSAGERS